MLPCFVLTSYPLTVDLYSLSSDFYTVKPKDHGFVQINEMTEKNREKKLFILDDNNLPNLFKGVHFIHKSYKSFFLCSVLLPESITRIQCFMT
jgi:hypothetical protein